MTEATTTRMEYWSWVEKYKPMVNHLTGEGERYETYGEDEAYIFLQDERHVWTELDDGTIVSGCHYVNRFNYYITQLAWQDFVEVYDEQFLELEEK